jgi:hypothetical protein
LTFGNPPVGYDQKLWIVEPVTLATYPPA